MSTAQRPVTEPDDAEVVQVEDGADYTAKVVVEGPVRTVELPSKSGGMFTVPAVDGNGQRLLGRDPRRKQATIVALAQDVRVGGSQAQASLAGARWPANVPLVYSGKDEVWAAAVTATTDVSVIVENWAD
jgi:hypothetical protein